MDDSEAFPIKPEGDIARSQLAKSGSRTLEDLTEKEIKYFQRLYPFTDNTTLCKKFGISNAVFLQLLEKFKKEGVELLKNESYSHAIVNVDPEKPAKNGKSPGYFLGSFLNTVNEEERREILQMVEEGIDPPTFMEYLIAFQSKRLVQGWQYERSGNGALSKTTNEAVHDMLLMTSKLDEMRKDNKVIHGIDDSFVGLLLSLNKSKEQEKWME
ncbi:MAG: hypothetical protein GYA51_01510 [Candidatus Methanofastidiosa archaeon]|nr:hypothetical protein [Candidatus Methanofastidiosa archaeon]